MQPLQVRVRCRRANGIKNMAHAWFRPRNTPHLVRAAVAVPPRRDRCMPMLSATAPWPLCHPALAVVSVGSNSSNDFGTQPDVLGVWRWSHATPRLAGAASLLLLWERHGSGSGSTKLSLVAWPWPVAAALCTRRRHCGHVRRALHRHSTWSAAGVHRWRPPRSARTPRPCGPRPVAGPAKEGVVQPRRGCAVPLKRPTNPTRLPMTTRAGTARPLTAAPRTRCPRRRGPRTTPARPHRRAPAPRGP